MSYEEVKDILNSYLTKKKLYDALTRSINTILDTCLKGVNYDLNFSSNNVTSSVEKAVEKVEKYRTSRDTIMSDMFELEDKISTMIVFLRDDEQALIIDRYINGIPLYKLAKNNGYTYESMRNKFVKITKKLSKN